MTVAIDVQARNLVGGELVEGVSGQVLAVIEPATGQPLATVPAGDAKDVERAVAAASRALPRWSRTIPGERAATLHALADAIEVDAEQLARLESRNVGKPLTLAREEIPLIADCVRFFAGAARCLEGRSAGEYLAGYESYIRREPIGVVVGIAPWNYPLLMAAWKFAPALAAGNVSILKPSKQTPLTALRLGELAAQIFPPGVLNIITGTGAELGAQLVSHPAVGLVSITGDTATGTSIARAAAERVARVHLELGGKAPVVVFDDADVEEVVAAVRLAGFVNSGQDCTAACRVIATPGIYEELVGRLIPAVSSLKVGNPAEVDDLDLGPVISAQHQRRVLEFIAQTDGEVLVGGKAVDSPGFFVQPTLIAEPRQDEAVVQQEIFGPVVTVQRARDDAEALRWANDVPFGLASSVWTRDLDKAMQASRHLDFGCVWINDHLPVTAEMPHGGFKQSGYGKDLSVYGLEDYTRVKHVMTRVKERIEIA